MSRTKFRYYKFGRKVVLVTKDPEFVNRLDEQGEIELYDTMWRIYELNDGEGGVIFVSNAPPDVVENIIKRFKKETYSDYNEADLFDALEGDGFKVIPILAYFGERPGDVLPDYSFKF